MLLKPRAAPDGAGDGIQPQHLPKVLRSCKNPLQFRTKKGMEGLSVLVRAAYQQPEEYRAVAANVPTQSVPFPAGEAWLQGWGGLLVLVWRGICQG